jgi:hypothetical protein
LPGPRWAVNAFLLIHSVCFVAVATSMWHIRTLSVPQTSAVGHDAVVRLVGFTVVGFLVAVGVRITGERVGFLALLGLPWPSALRARHATVSPNNSLMVSWCRRTRMSNIMFLK